MSKKAAFFQARAQDFSKQTEALQSRYNTISFFRIIVFVVFTFLVVWSISNRDFILIFIFSSLFLIVFGLIVRYHNQIKKNMDLCQKIHDINDEEVRRQHHEFNGIYGGDEFIDEKHPYTSDLDVFGRSSLFQLINRAGTVQGMLTLKSWFAQFSTKGIIETRQKMVKELMPLIDWRQNLQAHGRKRIVKKENEHALTTWLEDNDFIGSKLFYKIIPYVMISFSLVLIIAAVYELISDYFLFLPFFITGYFLYKIHDYSRKTYEMTDSGVKILESVENMLLSIEGQYFSHGQLVHLKNQLSSKGLVASQKVKELRKILELLNLRGNMIYQILNLFFLLDYIFLAKAEKWRSDFGDEITIWFNTIAEFEALNSLAAFAFANENFVFPKIMENPYIFKCERLGHPLIPEEKRVNNDFNFSGKGKTCIITGSNMAGKSTFLRTVGVNAVLAFAGAPVCADSMDISEFLVFSSMRTKDNLEENISSFYAELLRLKMLLEEINEGKPIFYLLDEILKGTNSVDRHIGAESLILQLNRSNAFGLVSTHDLELGKLSEKNNLITNFNFSSSIIGDEIVFDYKLQEGICRSTNASQLMAKIGIQIKS